jgi:hypothetical protein
MIERNELLAKYGWTIECESPFEIRNEDGSFASGQAAIIVVTYLTEEFEAELKPPVSHREDSMYDRGYL